MSTNTGQGQRSEGKRTMEKATFAAGCFWGVEAAFRGLPGVADTSVGYTGGQRVSPSYQEVCTGKTGHAESVEIAFDPKKVSYDQLLEMFWEIHDPTTINRQGPDVGHQYRSAIFFHTPEQERAARASRDRHDRSGQFDGPIVTEILPAGPFFKAEEYHQQYLAKRGMVECAVPIRRD